MKKRLVCLLMALLLCLPQITACSGSLPPEPSAAPASPQITEQQTNRPASQPLESNPQNAEIPETEPPKTVSPQGKTSLDLSRYSLWTDSPEAVSLDRIAAAIQTRTGVSLPEAQHSGPNTILFTVDETLSDTACQIKAQEETLTFAVYSKFALPYLEEIADTFFKDNDLQIPADFQTSIPLPVEQAASLPEETEAEAVLVCETDRDPLTYACSDPVTFRISLVADRRLAAVPSFRYSYRADDGTELSGTVPGDSGAFILTVPGCSQPGTALLKVEVEGADENLSTDLAAGVVFDMENITTAKPAPDDFRSFWDSQVQLLQSSTLEEAEFHLCSHETKAGYLVYDAVVQSPGGDVYLHITVPENAAPHSQGIKMRFMAYLFESASVKADEGMITVSVNAHSIPNDLSEEAYEEYSDTIDCWVDEADTREDCYFRNMILRDLQALRYAEEKFRDLWDGETVDVSGGSMGGFQSIAVAALAPEVTSVGVTHPWMCDLAGGDAGRNDGWAPDWSEAGQYFDTVYFAPYITARVRKLTAGLGDTTSPPTGVLALYNAIPTTEKRITVTQNARHNGEPGEYDESYTVKP